MQAFHGELDASNRASIENTLDEIKRFAPGTTAILDLSDVQYLDTTFLNALLRGGSRPRIRRAPAKHAVAYLHNYEARFAIRRIRRSRIREPVTATPGYASPPTT